LPRRVSIPFALERVGREAVTIDRERSHSSTEMIPPAEWRLAQESAAVRERVQRIIITNEPSPRRANSKNERDLT
jgi:hypothetical protein